MGGAALAGLSKSYGFERVERLAGNIGYLDIRVFAPISAAGQAAAEAISMLSGVDALVIDLRNHRGGDRGMGAWLSSLLFDTESALASRIYLTAEAVAASASNNAPPLLSHYIGGEVYVLVGPQTPSVARNFARTLQRLGRAVVVGEVFSRRNTVTASEAYARLAQSSEDKARSA